MTSPLLLRAAPSSSICSGHRGHAYRLAATAPMSGCRIEHTGAGHAAEPAMPKLRESPGRQFVPVASDQRGAATVTIRGLPHRIVDVARIDVTNAGLDRDAPCLV